MNMNKVIFTSLHIASIHSSKCESNKILAQYLKKILCLISLSIIFHYNPWKVEKKGRFYFPDLFLYCTSPSHNPSLISALMKMFFGFCFKHSTLAEKYEIMQKNRLAVQEMRSRKTNNIQNGYCAEYETDFSNTKKRSRNKC